MPGEVGGAGFGKLLIVTAGWRLLVGVAGGSGRAGFRLEGVSAS
jgi:hypothetical protein